MNREITLLLGKNDEAERERALQRVMAGLRRLPLDRAWTLTISEKKPSRTDQQNRYLWGVCYRELCAVLPGWEAKDVHEYMLGECFGWERMEGMGRVRLRPVKRSSALNKQEFADFVAFVQRKAAEHGCHIPEAVAA